LVFVPRDPAQLEALRAAVGAKAEHMKAGGCAAHKQHAQSPKPKSAG
jgi:hypothetical protein